MRVMQYAGAEVRGGLLAHVEILTRGLLTSRHDVHVLLSPARGADASACACAEAGAKVTRLSVRGKTDLAGQAKLHRLVGRENPDIFHIHLSSPVEAIPALLAAKSGGARHIVTTEHAPTWYPLRRPYSRAAKRLAARLLDAVIAVCEADAQFLREEFAIAEEALTVIRNGIPDFPVLPGPQEARALLGLPAGEQIIVGAAGELEEKKGVGDLLEAAAASGIPRLTVALAGEGSLVPELRRNGARLPFHLALLGRLDGIGTFLAALDIFVLPSRQEALPMALLEAMWVGLPIVASRVGGIGEAVRDGVEGLLVEPSRPDQIASALGRLAADRDLARQLGDAAHRRAVESFGSDRMVRHVEALYRRILGERPLSGDAAGWRTVP